MKLVETKTEFIKEKMQEKKAIQTLIASLKTQITQTQRQTRKLSNGNQQAQDVVHELDKACETKSKKTSVIERQVKDLGRDIGDLMYDCNEVAECKRVLETEIREEATYQDKTRELIQ